MNANRQKDAKIIGENIASLLKQKNMSQQDMANTLGVSASTISTWINGKRMPRIGTLKRIADYFSVSPLSILQIDNTSEIAQLSKQYNSLLTQGDNSPLSKENANSLSNHLGTNIAELLIQNGKEQRDLANALGVCEGAVSAWVHGKRFPRIEHIKKMCQFFEVPQSALLENEFAEPPSDDIINNLFANIKTRRKELNMTQQELAEKCGYIDRSSIAKIDNGETDITSSKIIMIANALETTPSELMQASVLENTQPTFDHPDFTKKTDVLQAIVARIQTNRKYVTLFQALTTVKPDNVQYITKTIERIFRNYMPDSQKEQAALLKSITNQIHNNPEYAKLFRVAANIPAADIEFTQELIKKLQRDEN